MEGSLTGMKIGATPLQMVRDQARFSSAGRDDDDDEDPDQSSVSSGEDDDEDLDHLQKQDGMNNTAMNNNDERDVHDTFVAKEAARTANCAGYCVLISLIAVGGMLAILAYFFVRGEEADDFDNAWDSVKLTVGTGLDRNAATLATSLTTLAHLFPARADASVETSPFVTVMDWQAFCTPIQTVLELPTITYAPVLTDEVEKTLWHTYSVDHAPLYLEQAGITDSSNPIPYIWKYDDDTDNQVVSDPGPAPYSPAYQIAPANVELINFNLQQLAWYQAAANTTDKVGIAVLTEPTLDDWTNTDNDNSDNTMWDVPHSWAVVPVPATLTEDDPEITGHVSATVPWTALLTEILQDHQQGITVVVDSCNGQAVHTYQLNGRQAVYMGEGDLHQTEFTSKGYSTFFYGLVSQEALTGRLYCKHEILVYPTKTYEDNFTSNGPVIYAVTISAVAFFAIVLFLSYDCIVRRQQSLVLGEAERSNAIVASLFPGKVARKLFMDTSRHSSGMDISTHSVQSNNLLNFMSKGEHKTVEAARPIAEIFPDATVMFADIAGFTAWSSTREPQQVFMLLESIFQAFDGIAKSFGVFKVETVGDCYMACCGVPEPNEDHATVMAQFARECLRKFHLVIDDLELKLGPDTSDLAMRFGLNSGPVTAGVLRGERARFQLFGDTVNTAARMESTGMRGKIQLSEQTADLLVAHGRGTWIKPREDAVQAKGKGTLKTYWLEEDVAPPRLWQENDDADEEFMTEINEDDGIDIDGVVTSGASINSASRHDDLSQRGGGLMASMTNTPTPVDNGAALMERKTQRLVDWNTELLMQLLKQVVARRFAVSGRRTQPDALWEMAQKVGEGHMPVEEVLEIIQMPDFDERAIRQVDPDTVILSPEVTAQCRTYVSMLAAMYRDNPFHNFEHASHVTMSVSKLLSRIVAPDIPKDSMNEVAYQEMLLHDHTYGITSDPLTQFAVVLSALIHDVDHRGVPNFILVKEDEHLGKQYENKSVAEQNSVDLAWNTLMRAEFSELRSCIFADLTELKRFRALLINSVIATDIFDKEQGTMRKNRWAKAFSESVKESGRQDQNRKATIVIEHLIQASDVAHTMQHWHVYQKWNERLFQEMYEAWLTGRSEKDPSEGWYNGEIWFYDNYIIPLAKKLKDCGVFGVASDEYLNYAMENRREWAAKGHEIVEKMVAKFGGKGEVAAA